LPPIDVKNLALHYGPTIAVDDVSIHIEDGEYCVLLGPSGCGKTSVLRMIAGFVTPTRGQVLIDGQDVTGLYPGDRGIAMIFQSYALYPHLTVRQNFDFPLKAARLSAEERQSRIREVGELLHLTELLDRYPRELSGGQQQRVAVGRALVRRCRILLLDEPLGNLDAKLRVEMRSTLKRLQRDFQMTAIHVTHDQVEAQALADQIVVMEGGFVRQAGTSEEIYDHPTTRFVAGFVGTPAMNFLEGRVDHGGARIEGEGWWLPFRGSGVGDQGSGNTEKLLVGVRPEHLFVHLEKDSGGFPAEVYVIEPQGNEVIFDLAVGSMILRARAEKTLWPRRPQMNETVYLTADPAFLHLFDPKTGNRLNP
jgi:multiple sugar transport system ATP-binding protein